MNALVEHARGQGYPQCPDRRPHATSPEEVDRRVSSPDEDGAAQRRRQLGHDIRHELSTVMLLASSLSMSHDAGPDIAWHNRLSRGLRRWIERRVQLRRSRAHKRSHARDLRGGKRPFAPATSGSLVVVARALLCVSFGSASFSIIGLVPMRFPPPQTADSFARARAVL